MLSILSKSLLVVFILAVLVIALTTFYIVPKLPAIDALRDVHMQVPLRVYSQDGSLIAEFGEKRRAPVSIDDAPKQLIEAFIAAEDDRFFEHPGVDWQGILRAVIALAVTGEKKQGGSTITMQVARNFFLSREKSYMRKLNEIFLAFKIDRELTKEEILELYINKIYLGQRAYGVGAAAQVYYGGTVSDLNLAQQAMLAGLPKAPSKTNPVSNPEQAVKRRAYVLGRMLKLGFIDQDDFDAADSAPVTATLHGASIDLEAPYVAEMVRKRLTEEFGDEAYSAGYKVTTTIRDKHQVAANQAIALALLQYDERHGYRGPEHNYELDETADENTWEQLLDAYTSIGGLFPALITEVREQSASAWLSGAGLIDIEWRGMNWAREYITENWRGPNPRNANEIVNAGDVVRVRKDADGEWRLAQIPAVEGGLVSLDPQDGATLALVGGFDFYRSKFNRVTQAKRQPGSSFKPFIYSAALENGYTPASVINDAPIVHADAGLEDKWRPENYSGRTFGPTRLRVALRHSRNLVSIRLLHAIGVKKALRHIARFGFNTDELPKNLSLALGSGVVAPWQLAGSYTVFANGGYRVEPYFIERIETYSDELLFQANPATVCVDCPEDVGNETEETTGRDDELPEPETTGRDDELPEPENTGRDDELPEPEETTGQDDELPEPENTEINPVPVNIAERVVNPQNIWITNHLTRDVIRRGTGAKAYRELKRDDLSGKTGTTNDQRDAWFAGFNASIVAVAWVGFDSFGPLGKGEVGGRAALPMWIEYMRVALQNTPTAIMKRPVGIVNIKINKESGCPASADDANAEFEVFMANQLPDNAECDKLEIPYDKNTESIKNPERIF